MTISKILSISRLGLVALMAIGLAGCGGGGGGGTTTPPPTPTVDLTSYVAQAKPEQCVLCHTDTAAGADGEAGSVTRTGPGHYSEYVKYADTSKFTLTVDGVSSVDNGDGTFTSTMTFTAKKNGTGLTADELAALNQKRFYAVMYDTTTRQFTQSTSLTGSNASNFTQTGDGWPVHGEDHQCCLCA